MKKISTAFLLLLVLTFTACGPSTKITDSWTAQNKPGRPLQNVMIVAMVPDRYQGLQRQIEQQLSTELSQQGIAVSSASSQYGSKYFDGMDEQQVMSNLKAKGVNGVLTVTLLDKDKEVNYVPGTTTAYPFASLGIILLHPTIIISGAITTPTIQECTIPVITLPPPIIT